MKTPQGWSKWAHREHGGEYSFLTVAKGTGPDHGTDFAYYLGADKATGALTAFVRRMDSWHDVMEPLDAIPALHEDTEGEPGILDVFDLGDLEL